MKDIVYRIGDTIKVINPVFVTRVGYPTTWPMLIEEFENHPKLQQAMRLLLLPENEQAKDPVLEDLYPTFNPRGKVAKDFISGVAKAANRVRGFGGRERQIFTEYWPHKMGLVLEVTDKRTVKTGTYYAPSHYVSYEGEHDYEPGGLSDEKTHVLLSTTHGEIEKINVQLVSAKRGSK